MEVTVAKFGSVSVDIKYCVPCGYGNLASWALSEMFAAGGPDVEISVTPGDAGVFTITVDGEVWYDKDGHEGRTPEIHDMKDLKTRLRNLVKADTPVAAKS